MLTSISIWAIYFASYLPDYVLMLIILIWKRLDLSNEKGNSFWNISDVIIWSVLLLFIIISVVVVTMIDNMKMNSRVKQLPNRNITIELLGPIFTQIITLGTTIFTD